MGLLTKGLIGKEDLNVQTNSNATETFERLSSTGDSVTMKKIPDLWDGLGKLNLASVESPIITATTITTSTIETAASDPGDIEETVALGTLTHDVLKTKINEILAAMRVAGFFST
ncbi:MAG: hypothetical protein KKE05_04560 [Nanoarchaeota archaeon]|nr:hypothetical protein [Nanoarchaeota archaeon]